MNPVDLPEVDVTVEPETRAFWEGLARGELVVTWCSACDDHVWPPRALCPVCLGAVTEQRTLTGEGEVYSYAVVHRGEGAFAKRDPYVLAYVTLDDGPTIVANVVGVVTSNEPGSETLAVGDRVRLVPREGEAGHVGAAFERV